MLALNYIGTSSSNDPEMELSAEAKVDLQQIIQINVEKIRRRFSELQAKVRQKITDHTELAAHVISMGILSEEEKKQVKEASSTNGVWMIVAEYWSFLDYGNLQDVIQNTCSEVEQEMFEYSKEVKKFCERRVSEFQSDSPHGGNDHCDTVMEKLHITLNLSDPPLKHIKNLKIVIANILQCKASNLILHDVGCGSVVVLFRVVPSIVHVFNKMKLSKEQEDKLKAVQVISLTFASSCIFSTQTEEGALGKLDLFITVRIFYCCHQVS